MTDHKTANVVNVTTDQIAEAVAKGIRQELDRWQAKMDERKRKEQAEQRDRETRDRLRALADEGREATP